jgi:translation initiation factor 1 (eIF-1/SUI1)
MAYRDRFTGKISKKLNVLARVGRKRKEPSVIQGLDAYQEDLHTHLP